MKLLSATNFFFLDVIICIWAVVIGDLLDDFKEEEIIPDVLDKAPKNLLQVIYNGKDVQFRKQLMPKEVKDSPHIVWAFDSKSNYTLIMVDPDVPTRAVPSIGEFLHWLVVNVPGDDFSKGETLVEYLGAAPPKSTGSHRYIFTVLRQPDKLKFDEEFVDKRTVDGRLNFSLKNFVRKYKLDDEPIASNMFTAKYDDSVAEIFESLAL